MGGRASDVKTFAEWRDRLRRFESSELSIDGFCRQEEVDRTQFAEWSQALRGGALGEGGLSGERPAFAPVTMRAHYIEVLLPGGGLVRLSSGVDRSLLLDVIRSVSIVLQESRS